jgi:hypothetical protein
MDIEYFLLAISTGNDGGDLPGLILQLTNSQYPLTNLASAWPSADSPIHHSLGLS